MAYEASVGGGIPWIDNIKHIQRLEPVTAFQGIFNGTSNYILSQMAEKDLDFATCLKEAQELGYAEKDPSDDIDGGDVCYKVCLSALTAFGKIADPRQVDQWGIRHLTKEDFAWAKANGRTIKLLGRGRQTGEKLSLQVLPVMLKKTSLLAGVGLNFNAPWKLILPPWVRKPSWARGQGLCQPPTRLSKTSWIWLKGKRKSCKVLNRVS